MDLSKKFAFISAHHEAYQLSENSIIVLCTSWNPETKQRFDSKLTFNEDGSFEEKEQCNGIETGKVYTYSGNTPIRDFLGY